MYEPSDDSFLLAEAVAGLPPGRLLEVGTGSGLVAILAARRGHQVVATDVSRSALELAAVNARRNGARVWFVRADLLGGLRGGSFDAIVFNPPYLPTAPEERLPGPLHAAFDGGTHGRAVVARFLPTLPPGTLSLLVVSSLQDDAELVRLFERYGLTMEIRGERAFPYERLRVVALRAAPWKA